MIEKTKLQKKDNIWALEYENLGETHTYFYDPDEDNFYVSYDQPDSELAEEGKEVYLSFSVDIEKVPQAIREYLGG